MSFEERVTKWAHDNKYKFRGIDDKGVLLERYSDGYPFHVNARLLEQIMTDEGYSDGGN